MHPLIDLRRHSDNLETGKILGGHRPLKINTKLVLYPPKASAYFYYIFAIKSEDESLSEIRLNKNGIPCSENAVKLFLQCFNSLSPSFNHGIYAL